MLSYNSIIPNHNQWVLQPIKVDLSGHLQMQTIRRPYEVMISINVFSKVGYH